MLKASAENRQECTRRRSCGGNPFLSSSAVVGLCLRAFSLAGLGTVLFAATYVNAAGLPGEYMNEIHTGYTTPHIPWAKPYAGGKVKAFFIAPYTAAREIAELAQRLDLDVYGETTFSESILGGTDRYTSRVEGTSPKEKERALRRKLAERYDVIVLANFPYNSLPLEIQYLIAKQVTEGSGLVLSYRREVRKEFFRHPDADAQEDISPGVPFGGLTFYRDVFAPKLALTSFEAVGPRVVSTYRVKKGRAVQIDFGIRSDAKYGGFCLTPREPFTFKSQAQYEYHQMLVVNAILWAAGKGPPIRVTKPDLCARVVRADALPADAEIVLQNSSTRLSATVSVTIRNAWGEVEQENRRGVELAAGQNLVPIRIGRLCGGGHYLDVRVHSRKGALGWGSFWLEVEPTAAIAELKMDKLSFERSEAAAGVVSLKGPAGDGLSLEVNLLDNYQRLYAKSSAPIQRGATEARFSVPLEAAISLAGRCRARLVRGEQLIDQAEAEFFVPKRELDVFPMLLWGTFPGILGHFLNNKIREAGFNTILAPHYNAGAVAERGECRLIHAIARDDMLCVPYTTHISRWRKCALGDDAEYAQRREKCIELVKHLAPCGPLVYSLGDENRIYPETGFQPGDRPGWLRHLKSQYESLDALNRSWGTSLGSWQEVELIRRNDAAGQRRYAQFHDTETYREELYAKWHHWHNQLYKAIDPHAKVGSEGSQPGDLEKTIRGLDFWGPYRKTVLNTLERSLAPRSLVRGNWFGGYVYRRHDLPGLRRFLWDTFLDGNNLFEVYCCYTCENIFKTDLTFGYWTDEFLPGLKEIVDGIGQLCAAGEHDVDAIAVYHSQASVHAAAVHSPFGKREADHLGALALIEDAGYQTYYITSNQALRGALAGPDAPKVVVLAYDQAISGKEAQAFADFVTAGGILIADVCPGIMDGQCSPGKSGALDTLFGVQRSEKHVNAGSAHLRVSESKVQSGDAEATLAGFEVEEVRADTAVRVAGGQALGTAGDAPALVVRRSGKGLAVLLNVALAGYPSLDGKDRAAFRDAVGRLISFSGLRPYCRVFRPDGVPLIGCRAPRFRRGAVKTVMLLPRREGGASGKVAARLQLAERGHVYDQRSGRYFGETSSVELQLDSTSATVLSVLPYRVIRMRVTGDREVGAGEFAELKVSLETASDLPPSGHVFRAKLFEPNGNEVWHCARTLKPAVSSRGPASVRIPFAFNDAPGTWRVLVRDVATRRESTFEITLRASATVKR